jgi:hypothetical protein
MDRLQHEDIGVQYKSLHVYIHYESLEDTFIAATRDQRAVITMELHKQAPLWGDQS